MRACRAGGANAILLLFCVALGAMGIGALWYWTNRQDTQAQRTIDELSARLDVARAVTQRLVARERRALLHVRSQHTDANGQVHSVVEFWELSPVPDSTTTAPDAAPAASAEAVTWLPTRRHVVQVVGEEIYIDTLAIKFATHFVAEGDGLRGRSLLVFRRIFGSGQAPETAEPLEPMVDGVPARFAVFVGEGGNDASARFERELWQDFYRLADDPAYAAGRGVDLAHHQAFGTRIRAGQTWEVLLSSTGNPGIRRLEAADHLFRMMP